jgi:hypothetical protein
MIWMSLLVLSMPPSASDPYVHAECWTVTEVGQAPSNTDLELQLDPVRATPEGILFPPATARHALWLVLCLRAWPEMAQAKLDEQAAVYEFRLAGERAIVENLRAEAAPPPASGPSWAGAILAGVIAFGVGVIAGGITVWALGR